MDDLTKISFEFAKTLLQKTNENEILEIATRGGAVKCSVDFAKALLEEIEKQKPYSQIMELHEKQEYTSLLASLFAYAHAYSDCVTENLTIKRVKTNSGKSIYFICDTKDN